MRQLSVDMPSRGALPNTFASILLRELTLKEEKSLFSAKRPFEKMLDMLQGCIIHGMTAQGEVRERVDIRDLPLVDMMHLLFRLRALSVDPMYEFKIPCNACNNPVHFKINILEDLETHLLPEGAGETYEITLEGDPDEPAYIVTMKHLTVKDQLMMDAAVRKRKASAGEGFDEGFLLRLARQIVSVDGKTMNPAEAEVFISSLPHRYYESMMAQMQDHTFGTDFEQEMECPVCGNHDKVLVPMTRDFLFRRREGSAVVRSAPDDGV